MQRFVADRTFRTSIAVLLFSCADIAPVWAAHHEEASGFNPGIIVAIAIVVLLIVALPIVIKYVQYIERVEAQNRVKAASGDLKSAIKNEIETLPGTETQHEQVSEILTQVIQKQVDKQVTEVKQRYVEVLTKKETEVKEATRKYKNTLAEKQQTESVIRSVAEGVDSAPAVRQLVARLGVEAPICEAIAAILAGEIDVDQAIDGLLNRPLKAER